jgi:hypothetical protein
MRPIASYEERLRAYEMEWRSFLRERGIVLLCVSMVAALAATYWLTRYVGLDLPCDWRVAGVAMALAAVALFLVLLKPRRPLRGDVERDQALRRLFGMDDRVGE